MKHRPACHQTVSHERSCCYWTHGGSPQQEWGVSRWHWRYQPWELLWTCGNSWTQSWWSAVTSLWRCWQSSLRFSQPMPLSLYQCLTLYQALRFSVLVLLTATASIKSSPKDWSCLYPHTHFYQYTYIVIDTASAQADSCSCQSTHDTSDWPLFHWCHLADTNSASISSWLSARRPTATCAYLPQTVVL